LLDVGSIALAGESVKLEAFYASNLSLSSPSDILVFGYNSGDTARGDQTNDGQSQKLPGK